MDNLIKEYIEYIENKRKLSLNTVSSYRADLKKYNDYLEENNIDIKDVVETDILNYLVELEKNNTSVSTIARTTSSIKSFHDYLFFSKICATDPAKNIKKPKIKKETVEILTEEEIEALLNFENLESNKLKRDKAIFEVLYGTGMKVSELIDLNVEDVDFEMGSITCSSSKNKRVIPLIDVTKKYLELYVNEARENVVAEGENALFVSALGHRFTRQGLWKIIKKYSKKANIDKNINPTMLRHSFAIHMIYKGANIASVNKILGNTNLSSIQSYLSCIDQNMRKEMNLRHPRK